MTLILAKTISQVSCRTDNLSLNFGLSKVVYWTVRDRRGTCTV